jgi:hypothetical protein
MGKRGFAALSLTGLKDASSLKKPVESGEAVTVAAPIKEKVAAANLPAQKEAKTADKTEAVEPNSKGLHIHLSDPGDSLICDSCQ